MAYIGNGPGSIRQGRRAVYEFTSTANQTAFSGTDENGLTLDLLQANDNDVYLNGVWLIITDDYTISGDVLTLTSGAASGDKLIIMTQDEIANDASYSKAASDSRYINYDGDIVNGTIQMGGSGNNITFADNNKAVFGDDSDLQIYHDNTGSYVKEGGTGSLYLQGTDVRIQTASGENILNGTSNGAVTLYHDNSPKLSTTSTGIDVTGNATLTSTDSGSSAAPEFELRRDNTGADANYIGQIKFTADNDADQNTVFAKITGKILDASDGTEDGIIEFAHKKAGSNVITGRWRSDSLQLLNGTSLTVDGTITGDLTGDTTGTHTGAVTGNVTGNVTGDMDIAAIAKDISDTAVDVFIYDTRKDSDGGAWRKRTQHTSWYNETLNTATRGARKEFPAVAVIVAEINQVTIYDGDDPDLPMWMVFNQGGAWSSSANLIMPTSPDPVSISFLNGILSIAYNSGYGVGILDFISESKTTIFANNVTSYNGNVSQRNGGLGHSSASDARRIVNSATNDVAMTILPNAPIDAATGLPVPTIAVATNGGVSIIKDDGIVVNKVTTDATTYSATVDFTKDGYLIVTRNNYSYFVITYLTAASGAHPSGWPYLNYFRSNGIAFPGPNGPSNNPHGDQQYGLANRAISLDNNNAATADTYGLNVFNINGGLSSPSNSVAYITSDYNTGWMSGNIKLSTLSDTDDTNVSDTNLNPYTPATGNLGSITLNPKKTYKVTITGYGDIDGQWPGYGNPTDGVYVYTGDTTAPGVGQANLNIQAGGTSGSPISSTVYIKNFPSWTFYTWSTGTVTGYSIQECDYNRTVYCHPVEVVGTVTKSKGGSDRDIVSYAGFGDGNYLQQPYNSSLDFSADFCIQTWMYIPSDTTAAAYHYGYASDQDQAILALYVAGQGLRTYTRESGGNWNYIQSSVPLNNWIHVTHQRKGGTVSTSINGILTAGSYTHTANLTRSGNVIRLGRRTEPTQTTTYWRGSLSLFRLSHTALSQEQIKKIYEDEKFLFQENAKATLYGSSDAVTALAYDDDTELLHVGTSAGRSVFQGLRRIDNTTDAVGAAISASNGMVAED